MVADVPPTDSQVNVSFFCPDWSSAPAWKRRMASGDAAGGVLVEVAEGRGGAVCVGERVATGVGAACAVTGGDANVAGVAVATGAAGAAVADTAAVLLAEEAAGLGSRVSVGTVAVAGLATAPVGAIVAIADGAGPELEQAARLSTCTAAITRSRLRRFICSPPAILPVPNYVH
jgi:hypothetical protein